MGKIKRDFDLVEIDKIDELISTMKNSAELRKKMKKDSPIELMFKFALLEELTRKKRRRKPFLLQDQQIENLLT